MRRGQNILEGLLPSSKLDVEEWIPDNPLEEENQRSREVGQTRSTATSILVRDQGMSRLIADIAKPTLMTHLGSGMGIAARDQ